MTVFYNPAVNSTSFSFFSEFGSRFPGQVHLELLLLGIITICGFLGNSLVIASTLLFKHMRTTSKMILSLQAASDLLLVCNVPLVMVVRVTEDWTLGSAICKIWMFFFSFSEGTTITCMGVLAIDRYMCICRPRSYNVLKSHSGISVVALALSNVAVMSPFVIGWNTLTLEKDGVNYTFCGLQWPGHIGNKIYIFIVLFLVFIVPLLMSAVLYTIIWLRVRQSNQRVTSFANSNSTTSSVHTKLLKVLILSVLVYVLMLLPFAVVCTMLFYTTIISSSVFLMILALLLANTVVNPALLSYFNVKYRACMRGILTCKIRQVTHNVASTAH